MSREIVLQWLDAVQRTARALDYEAHMDLVSRRVQVHGIPGFEVIGYEDWTRQCEHEFKEGLLRSVGYQGLRMTVSTDTRIMFQTRDCEGEQGFGGRQAAEPGTAGGDGEVQRGTGPGRHSPDR